jgi:adenosylmethionine-8-amino-7-oxononanoate aminotransferase
MPSAPIAETTSTFYYVTYTMHGSTYSSTPLQGAGAVAARIHHLEQQDSASDIRVIESQVTTRERYIDPAELPGYTTPTA